MSWLRISVNAHGATTDAVCARLEALGAVSVSVEAGSDESLLEPAPGERPLWSSTRVSALFDSGREPADLRARAERALAGLGASRLHLAALRDQDWLNAWRQNAEPRCFGNGLWVLPHDAQVPPGASTVVRLDPGLAFGTGSHPTTALCLQWLAGQAVAGRSVLDLGCGSGILAIAAAKLGAARVLAVDHDPQALAATAGNADLNHVTDRIEVSPRLPREGVDMVLANILANALETLAPRVEALTAPGADLVLSGILPEQVEQVWDRYRLGFCDRQVAELDGWTRIGARRL